MVEEKIEELKKVTHPNKNTSHLNFLPLSGERGYIQINTKIDLNIEAYLEDSFFGSELDKINFYREIESLKDIKELDNIILDFKNINQGL